MISEYSFLRIISRNRKSTISRKTYRRRCVNGFAVEYKKGTE